MTIVLLLLVLACTACMQGVVVAAEVIPYGPLPTSQASEEFSLIVNGQEVFVEKFLDISYAHFAFGGTADVVVTAGEEVHEYRVSPVSRQIAGKANGRSLSFTLNEPTKLVVTVNELEKLFIFAEAQQRGPMSSDAGVVSILDYGVDNTGKSLQTTRIQQAIDDISASRSHPILYFPPGMYLTGTLTIKSNVQIHLAPGALIQGSGNADDFVRDPLARVTPLIRVLEAENVRITGPGVIDGSGTALRAQGKGYFVLSISGSRNVIFDGPILRDSGSWNSLIFHSDDVVMRDVKVINDIYGRNTDGINPDGSHRVRIEDAFMYTGDDNVAVKSRLVGGASRSCEDIVVSKGVFLTTTSSLKVGTESTSPLRNIVFEDIDIVETDRAASIYLRDAGYVDGVQFRNIRLEAIRGERIHGQFEQRLMDIRITNRREEVPKQLGPNSIITNVTFVDFVAEVASPKLPRIHGYDHRRNVSELTFENVWVAGQVILNPEQGGFDVNDHVDLGTLRFVHSP
jgi:hypothetical protein